FTWTFFLKTKDETSGILREFITEIKNLKDLKVKIIRTPQQNGVAERRNRTLIKAARTMLADAKLPVTFWAEAVNTACYVQNRVKENQEKDKIGSKPDKNGKLIKSNLGWKVKDFRGMTFEEINAKFTTVWKQLEDFIPIGSKEEAERFKRKGIRPPTSDKEMEL
nr:hypothetical protein [Tanacetum cinerariifolium]